jgi:hypothetical protein
MAVVDLERLERQIMVLVGVEVLVQRDRVLLIMVREEMGEQDCRLLLLDLLL